MFGGVDEKEMRTEVGLGRSWELYSWKNVNESREQKNEK